MAASVIPMEIGTDDTTTKVIFRLRRNKYSTTKDSRAPIKPENSKSIRDDLTPEA